MNPLKAPPSLLHGFGIPVSSSSINSNSSSLLNTGSIINKKSRTVSLGGDSDLFLPKTTPTPSTPPSTSMLLPSAKEAELLMSFSSIAKNEIKANPLWNDDDDEEEDDARDQRLPGFPRLPLFSPGGSYSRRPNTSAKKNSLWSLGPRLSPLQLPSESSSSSSEDDEDSSDSSYHIEHQGRKRTKKQYSYQQSQQQQKRARTVSIDSPMPESPVMMTMKSRGGYGTTAAGVGHQPNLVSPLSTPVLVKAGKVPAGFAITKKSRLRSKAKRERRPSHKAAAAAKKVAFTTSTAHTDDDKKRLAVTVPKGKTLKTILRKKFSWKNYPEVSAYLGVVYVCAWYTTGSHIAGDWFILPYESRILTQFFSYSYPHQY